MLKKAIMGSAIVAAFSSAANANVTAYTNEALYEAATTGTTTTTFGGVNTFGNITWAIPNNVGTITANPFAVRPYVPSYGWPTSSPAMVFNSSGYKDTITLTFNQPLRGVGLDFGVAYNWAGGTTVVFDVDGQSFTTTPGLTYNGVKPSFLGFVSDTAFNKLTITDNTGGFAFDKLVTSTGVAPIPEPETYALMLAGLGLLGVAARRRKQKSAT
jgi:hypothetical protein